MEYPMQNEEDEERKIPYTTPANSAIAAKFPARAVSQNQQPVWQGACQTGYLR